MKVYPNKSLINKVYFLRFGFDPIRWSVVLSYFGDLLRLCSATYGTRVMVPSK